MFLHFQEQQWSVFGQGRTKGHAESAWRRRRSNGSALWRLGGLGLDIEMNCPSVQN
jgi:hypothetical protein